MARGNYVTINSTFEPLTFEQIMQPLATATAAHTEAEKAYNELLTKASDVVSKLNPEVDKDSIDTYNAFQNDLTTGLSDLNANGLSAATRSNLSRLYKEYGEKINPMVAGYNRREEQAKEIRTLRAKDHSIKVFNDPLTTELSKYIANPGLNYSAYSGDKLTASVADAMSNFARTYNERASSEWSPAEHGLYQKIQKGLTLDDVDDILDNLGTGKYPHIDGIIQSSIEETGVLDWNDEKALKEAIGIAAKGVYWGLGNFESDYKPLKTGTTSSGGGGDGLDIDDRGNIIDISSRPQIDDDRAANKDIQKAVRKTEKRLSDVDSKFAPGDSEAVQTGLSVGINDDDVLAEARRRVARDSFNKSESGYPILGGAELVAPTEDARFIKLFERKLAIEDARKNKDIEVVSPEEHERRAVAYNTSKGLTSDDFVDGKLSKRARKNDGIDPFNTTHRIQREDAGYDYVVDLNAAEQEEFDTMYASYVGDLLGKRSSKKALKAYEEYGIDPLDDNASTRLRTAVRRAAMYTPDRQGLLVGNNQIDDKNVVGAIMRTLGDLKKMGRKERKQVFTYIDGSPIAKGDVDDVLDDIEKNNPKIKFDVNLNAFIIETNRGKYRFGANDSSWKNAFRLMPVTVTDETGKTVTFRADTYVESLMESFAENKRALMSQIENEDGTEYTDEDFETDIKALFSILMFKFGPIAERLLIQNSDFTVRQTESGDAIGKKK